MYVTDPKPLVLAEGKRVYHMCIQHRSSDCVCITQTEWNGMWVCYIQNSNSLTCEWLCHYELWVCIGTWHGGGIHHETEAEKQANKQKKQLMKQAAKK
ncbi:MAG: hypothetical protein IPG39_16455 [Bacteroidetes bacterium]|nr:hypothetical protein [Bacteroidota bacterium]